MQALEKVVEGVRCTERKRNLKKKRVPGMRIERMPYWNEAVVGAGGPERAR